MLSMNVLALMVLLYQSSTCKRNFRIKFLDHSLHQEMGSCGWIDACLLDAASAERVGFSGLLSDSHNATTSDKFVIAFKFKSSDKKKRFGDHDVASPASDFCCKLFCRLSKTKFQHLRPAGDAVPVFIFWVYSFMNTGMKKISGLFLAKI